MKNKNDGGSAYPFEQITERCGGLPTDWKNHSGMSLRDYFAGQALIGSMSRKDEQILSDSKAAELGVPELLSKVSYVIADAMLKERNK